MCLGDYSEDHGGGSVDIFGAEGHVTRLELCRLQDHDTFQVDWLSIISANIPTKGISSNRRRRVLQILQHQGHIGHNGLHHEYIINSDDAIGDGVVGEQGGAAVDHDAYRNRVA